MILISDPSMNQFNLINQCNKNSTQKTMTTSLYHRIGGFEMLDKVIPQFYQYMLMDSEVNEFFLENVSDIARLHRTMIEQLSVMTGGPACYKGKNMRDLHKHMKIKQIHFDITCKHMSRAFRENGLSENLIKELVETVQRIQKDIVNTK